MEVLNRSITPAVHALESFSLPVPEVSALGNGARIHYLPNSTQEVIRLELVFQAGKLFEKTKGVAYFTSKLVLEGTTGKSAKQLADVLDFYGASLDVNQGFDWATVTLYCLSKHFQKLLPVVMEVLTQPAFPEKEFVLLKTRTAQNIQIERKKPAYIANELFTKSIYGENHPYASGLTEAEIKAVDLNQVQQFFREFYTLPEVEVFVCGHYTEADKSLIKETFSENSDKKAMKPAPEHITRPGLQHQGFIMPESLQAAVRVGTEFPEIGHSDYLKLTVLNKVLGGYFGSRLMKNIREDKGFTYGIYSSISPRRFSTLFLIATEVNIVNTAETVTEIRKELTLLQDELISEEELDTVKNYMIGKYLNEVNTVFDQCDRYKHIVLHQLPANHFDQYIQTIREITPQELQRLARKYFSQPLTVAVAGTEI